MRDANCGLDYRNLLDVSENVSGEYVAFVFSINPLESGVWLKVLRFAEVLTGELDLHFCFADIH